MRTSLFKNKFFLFCTMLLLMSMVFSVAAQNSLWQIEDGYVPLEENGTTVLTPQNPGTVAYFSGGATLDASNSSEGYVMIRYEGGNNKVKVQITRSGGRTYTYDLNSKGRDEVFPLTNGDGVYKIGVYTNVYGSSYAQALYKNIEVKLRDPHLPFLYPSQYVNFNADSNVTALALELAAGTQSELDVISNVYNYVISNISYDTNKAKTVRSGYLPEVDSVLESGKGICFDYAAVMTSMLRSQQIPTRLEVGYVSGGAYHAWISTYVRDKGWINGVIRFDGKSWKLMDPTFASGGGNGIEQYIGDGGNYSMLYRY